MDRIAMDAPNIQFEYGQFQWPRSENRRVVHATHVLSMADIKPSTRAEGWHDLGTRESAVAPLGPILMAPAAVPFHTRGDGGTMKVARLKLLPTNSELDVLFENRDPGVFQKCLNIKCPNVALLMKRLVHETRAPGLASDVLLEALGTAIRIDLLRYLSLAREPVHTAQRLSSSHLRQVTDYIHTHLHKRISIRELALLVGSSERHFMRLFRAATGETVHRYVEQKRFNAAKRLLDESDLPLKQIAHRLGFSSRVGFTLAFQRFSGLSPRDYRRQNQH